MSLFELLVVLIVAILVIKPEDLPLIIKKLQNFFDIITKTRAEIISYFSSDQKEDTVENDNIDQINFYLKKIVNLGSTYEGEYSLTKIKAHYQELIKELMETENKPEE